MFSMLLEEFVPSVHLTKSELADLEILDSKLTIDDYLSFAKDWLTKQHMDFTIDRERAKKYYQFNRGNDFYPNYLIPIGKNDFMPYQGHSSGAIIERDLDTYLEFLFKDGHDYHEFFANVQTVVDLGSGRAVALMQLAEKFSKTAFIGIDNLYKEKRKIYPRKAGMQLSFGDWNNLTMFSRESVDAVISVMAVNCWGIPGLGCRRDEAFDLSIWQKILKELHRVLRKNGIFVLGSSVNNQLLRDNIDNQNWEILPDFSGVAARKV